MIEVDPDSGSESGTEAATDPEPEPELLITVHMNSLLCISIITFTIFLCDFPSGTNRK